MAPEAKKVMHKRELDGVSGGMGATWSASVCLAHSRQLLLNCCHGRMRDHRRHVANSTKSLQGDLGIPMYAQNLLMCKC